MLFRSKYGGSTQSVYEYLNDTQKNLSSYENKDEIIKDLEKKVAIAKEKYLKIAEKISQARKKSAKNLSPIISTCLAELGFKQSNFKINFNPLNVPTSNGIDLISFEFSPNRGEPLKPVSEIASSGELARVMLALKSALADVDFIPLLIFDEIDANIGGNIAQAVGTKMTKLANNRQVISITHLPQVAAQAQHHYAVNKNFTKVSTLVTLKKVENRDRISEIARMLGNPKDSETINLAKKLLSNK